jgi:Methyltransferase domain
VIEPIRYCVSAVADPPADYPGGTAAGPPDRRAIPDQADHQRRQPALRLLVFDPPQLEIIRHDITADPPPEGQSDLIHARLVLGHLPARDAIMARLVQALKPGRWVLIGDFDSCLPQCLDPLNGDQWSWFPPRLSQGNQRTPAP